MTTDEKLAIFVEKFFSLELCRTRWRGKSLVEVSGLCIVETF